MKQKVEGGGGGSHLLVQGIIFMLWYSIIIICAQAHVVFVDVMSTLMSHEKGSSWHDDLPYCLEGCEFCFFSFFSANCKYFWRFFFLSRHADIQYSLNILLHVKRNDRSFRGPLKADFENCATNPVIEWWTSRLKFKSQNLLHLLWSCAYCILT